MNARQVPTTLNRNKYFLNKKNSLGCVHFSFLAIMDYGIFELMHYKKAANTRMLFVCFLFLRIHASKTVRLNCLRSWFNNYCRVYPVVTAAVSN